MHTYFVITSDSDGISVTPCTQEELTRQLDEGRWSSHTFVERMPDDDPAYWGDLALIIKGTIVVPKAKEIITTWKVD